MHCKSFTEKKTPIESKLIERYKRRSAVSSKWQVPMHDVEKLTAQDWILSKPPAWPRRVKCSVEGFEALHNNVFLQHGCGGAQWLHADTCTKQSAVGQIAHTDIQIKLKSVSWKRLFRGQLHNTFLKNFYALNLFRYEFYRNTVYT